MCFSIGYTYAYFSATAVSSGAVKMNRVSVTWINVDNSYSDIDGLEIYNSSNTITLTNDLKRGVHVPIEAQVYLDTGEPKRDDGGNIVTSALKLGLRNAGDVEAYFRLSLVAKYKEDGQDKDISEYVKLELYKNSTYVEITSNGWFKHTDGYYYLGSSATALTPQAKGAWFPLADYIYLDPTSSAELYDKEVSITLKVEAIQAQHKAHISEWGLPDPA